MKKILLLLLSLCLLLSMIACDQGNDPTGDETTSETDQTAAVLSESEWAEKTAFDNFDNYTVMMSGKMSVTQNGEFQGESDATQCIKVADDKLSIEIFMDGESMDLSVLDGDLAKTQKTQATQLFSLLLEQYEYYEYDAEKKVYCVTDTVSWETVLTGLSYETDGSVSEFDVPAVIEIREAEVTFAEDGTLVSLVCDYSQSMSLEAGETTTSGLITWTFSDFGTTVIEAEPVA